MIWGAARRRARVDAAVAAYTQWRSERDAVRAAYRDTQLGPPTRSSGRPRHQLARMQALPGAW